MAAASQCKILHFQFQVPRHIMTSVTCTHAYIMPYYHTYNNFNVILCQTNMLIVVRRVAAIAMTSNNNPMSNNNVNNHRYTRA